MKQTAVMRATLGRLPAYLKYLKDLDTSAQPNISATTIAKALGLGEVQVRKDLNAVSGAGRPKLGYVTVELIEHLESVLGQSSVSKAVIVGAGRLGKALLEYNGFSDYGLVVSAAFDIDESKFDSVSQGKSVFPLENLEDYCSSEEIKIGIITVPGSVAQNICDRLVKSGITAIWNFAPCQLDVPDGVTLQQENLALSLAHLKLQMNAD